MLVCTMFVYYFMFSSQHSVLTSLLFFSPIAAEELALKQKQAEEEEARKKAEAERAAEV